MDEAETLCDRVALINRGRFRVLDTPEAIAAESGGARVRFVPSQPVDDEALYAVRGAQVVERKGRYVTVTGTGDLAALLRAIMWYSPSGAAVRAILYSVFNATPPVTTLAALVGYTLVFAFVAVRYFRWE
jgi:ABC-type multidrug transport system ATPase subunit